jgi:hypothetical protein
LVALSSSARAEKPAKGPAAIAEARRLVRIELRYSDAILLLERALLDPDLAVGQRAEAYELLGTAFVAKGQTEQAEAAFGSLLELDPDHRLEAGISPKIRDVFARVKRRKPRQAKLLTLTASVAAGTLRILGVLDDPDARLTAVDLYTRRSQEEGFTRTRMNLARPSLTATVSARGPGRVDYYLEGRGAAGQLLLQIGGRDGPSTIFVETVATRAPAEAIVIERPSQVAEQAEQAWYEKWWIWVLLGAAAAGGIGLAVALGRGDAAPQGTLPPLRLP